MRLWHNILIENRRRHEDDTTTLAPRLKRINTNQRNLSGSMFNESKTHALRTTTTTASYNDDDIFYV